MGRVYVLNQFQTRYKVNFPFDKMLFGYVDDKNQEWETKRQRK